MWDTNYIIRYLEDMSMCGYLISLIANMTCFDQEIDENSVFENCTS